MDEDDPFLDQIWATRNLYGNVREPYNISDFNIGMLGDTGRQAASNPFMVLGAQSLMNWAFGREGMLPTQFFPGRNLYDQYADKAYWSARRTALAEASQADRQTYTQMLRGIARMRGTPWGLEQQRSANIISGDVAMMAPILAEVMPETFDALHGTRGSATVLARFLHRGGRFGIDPVTGRPGMGAASVGAMAREIQAQYFAPGADVTAWRGMGMGQAGALFEELQNRGMAGRPIGTYAPDEALERIVRSQEGREVFVRRLREEHPDEFLRLRDRATAAGPGAGLPTAALRPEDQVQRVARTDEAARLALDTLRQMDPAEFGRIVERFDRERREQDRIAGAAPEAQTRALATDVTAAAAAAAAVQRRDPPAFGRLQAAADRQRPGGALAGLGADEQVRRIAEAEHVTEEAIHDIQQTQPGRFEALLRQFDANRVARRLRDMAGAVGAMREIFGDMGRPNAPMAQLLEGINMLTQGGLATMNPAELERVVRTTRVLSRETGMGMNAMLGLTAQAAEQADRLGLNRAFAIQAVHGAAEFGAAFGQVGHGELPAWGRVDRTQLTIMDQQLRLQAAGSRVANQLGAAMRFVEAQEAAGRPVTPELQQLATAVREGRTDFTPDPAQPGRRRSFLMEQDEWMEFMRRQGVQPETARQLLMAREANQPQIARYQIGDIARELQPADARMLVEPSFQRAARAALTEAGVTGDEANRLASVVASEQARVLLAMPPEDRIDLRRRNQVLGAAAQTVLQAAGVAPAVRDAFRPELQAEIGFGNFEHDIRRNPLTAGYPSVHAFLDTQSPIVAARRRIVDENARVTVQMQTLLGGLGQADWVRRLSDMIQNPPENLSTAMGQVFNGLNIDTVRDRLAAAPADVPGLMGFTGRERMAVAMREMAETLQRFERVRNDRNLTPERQRDLMRREADRAQALAAGGGAATAEIRRELEGLGIVRPGEELAPVLERVRRNPDAFPNLTPEVRNRITAFRAVGGGLDPRQVEAETNRILVQEGFRPDQLVEILSGRAGARPDVRERLQALQDQGIATGMPAAGFAIGATVGSPQLDAAVTQGRLLTQVLGGDLAVPVAPAAGGEGAARARRHSEAAIDIGTRTVDALLGGGESVRALGAGGFDAALRVRERQQEMAYLAREVGLTPAEMLVRGDRKDERVHRFLDAYDEVQTGLAGLSRRLADPGARRPMTDDEFSRYQDYWRRETADTDKQNEEAVGKVLGLGASATEQERQELAEMLGTGDESVYRRRKLDLALESRGRILGMEQNYGVDIVGLRDLLRPGSRLAAADRPALEEDLRRAGALAEGVAPEQLRAFLGEIAKPAAPEQREIKLSGRLDLRNGDIVATGEPVTPAGATPAVAGGEGWA